MRRLPWNYVKYDDSDVDWSIEPVNWGGEFETDTGGTPFPLIQQVGVNKGSVVGFEVIEPSQASEFWKVFRISDGPDDASDPDSF